MVRCIKVPLQRAEHAKRTLLETQTINQDYRPKKIDAFLYMPITENYQGEYEVVEQDLDARPHIPKARPFKEELEEVLSPKEMEEAKTAYEMVGSIAIIEVPDTLEEKDCIIGEALLRSNPMITTVVKKEGKHDGVFRTQDMKVIAGENTKIATYKENNCMFQVNVEEVYFSARLSTERKRIAAQVKEGEEILVMFSGAAPYPCVLSKNTKAKHIIGVEINPAGHELAVENVKKNKCTNVEVYCGDVRKIVPTLNMKFDRVIMPLPKTAEEFLDVTFPACNKNAIVHLYGFYHEDEFDKAIAEIDKYSKQAGRSYEILDIVKSGQQSPRTYRICVDFKVTD